jgi:glutamine cyclotransferase
MIGPAARVLMCLAFHLPLVLAAACSDDGRSPAAPAEPIVSDGVPSYTYRVVREYPHDPQAFTQGLVYENDMLYEGTGLYDGLSSVRRVDLETGQVLQIHSLPANRFGEGITIHEGRIIQLTYTSRLGFIYDLETFMPTDTFHYASQGWGLTHDSEHLIMSDGSDRLFFFDPYSFQFVDTLEVRDGDRRIHNLNELEYIDGRIFANIWYSDQIAVIDPATGLVTNWVDLTGILSPQDQTLDTDVLNGIAFDAAQRRLLVTGKYWPKLFEIRLIPDDSTRAGPLP